MVQATQRKALLFGSKGFVSSYLRDHLDNQRWDVYEFNLRDGQDIRDYEAVRNFIDEVQPDAIFHVAAMAAPAESFHNPQRAFEVNTIGSTNVLEAVRQLGIKTRILLVGTSEEYGNGVTAPGEYEVPRSPYAISKLAMTKMGMLYAEAYGMNIVITRAFNHTGPGRKDTYMESSFARQIAEIEAGKRDFIEHGNLNSVRNFTDVRDVVRAYEILIDFPSGIYNVCSDTNITVDEVLTILCGYSTKKIDTIQNEALVRPADFSFQRPDVSPRLKAAGWEPTIKIEETLLQILDYWRQRV